MSLRAQALGALATVYDPTLDEQSTALGVRSGVVPDRGIDTGLRLPTPRNVMSGVAA